MNEKPRSNDQHKRFFALIKALFHHWPEGHPFKPDNEEHLRAYVLVKSGHRSIKAFFPDPDDGLNAHGLAKVVPIIITMMMNRYCWAWAEGDELRVCAPLSTKFTEMSHKDACVVYDAADAYILSLGFDPDQLLKEHEGAA